MTDETGNHTGNGKGGRTTGAFDIRTIVGALLGIYGVVLVAVGLFAASDAELDKADGLNLNLWAGLGMVAAAALFLFWARVRPIVVPDDFDEDEDPPETTGGDGRAP